MLFLQKEILFDIVYYCGDTGCMVFSSILGYNYTCYMIVNYIINNFTLVTSKPCLIRTVIVVKHLIVFVFISSAYIP
jgi:hypothetical protein